MLRKGVMMVEERHKDRLPVQLIYNYKKSKQTSTNNVLPMDINIIFRIKTNGFSADRREGTDFNNLSDNIKKIFLILEVAT